MVTSRICDTSQVCETLLQVVSQLAPGSISLHNDALARPNVSWAAQHPGARCRRPPWRFSGTFGGSAKAQEQQESHRTIASGPHGKKWTARPEPTAEAEMCFQLLP